MTVSNQVTLRAFSSPSMTYLCVFTSSNGGSLDLRRPQDLTRLESGNETAFNEPFDLRSTIEEATLLYKNEATRRNLSFTVDVGQCPKTVLGDAKKIKTVVANLTANAGAPFTGTFVPYSY
jgi:phosphoglycerate-specific signal transduction histidine kinase